MFNKTIIMVTHDQRAVRFVEQVFHLDKGILAGIEPGGRAPAASGQQRHLAGIDFPWWIGNFSNSAT